MDEVAGRIRRSRRMAWKSLELAALCIALLAAASSQRAGMQVPVDEATRGSWGDQGDQTYRNPVLPADFSDLDVIRVSREYYAISSTFQYSPGVALLASHDLVNWRIVSHVVPDVTRISPALGWQHMDRAGRGIWAGSIRYHQGRYWVYFGTPDEGMYMSTARRVTGPWTPVAEVLHAPGWDDPCPFWDQDGQEYLVTTHYKPDPDGTTYNIHLFKLSKDGKSLMAGADRVIHRSEGSEANKLYRIHGLYYHYYSEVKPEGRVIMMERAQSLHGPWETRQLNHVHASVDKEPNQGGLVQLPKTSSNSAKWYFLSHQGTGDWEGRAAVLLTVTWQDGWPIIGRPGPDGIGNMTWSGQKPIRSYPRTSPVTSDSFDAPRLKPEWEWNYQPRAAFWSLKEHPGSLRLHAFAPLRPGDFSSIGNVLTQRSMRTEHNEVTLQLDLRGMVNGQQAGLAHYAATNATLSVVQAGDIRRLSCDDGSGTLSGPSLGGEKVWLRSTWNFKGVSHFSYSLDGLHFADFGRPYQLTWGNYRGDRVGIFTTNPDGERGYVDVESFTYEVAR